MCRRGRAAAGLARAPRDRRAGRRRRRRGQLFFAQLSAGAEHGRARTGSGAGYCWGDNFYAALGIGTSGPGTSTTAPVPVREPQ
jgi:hypothetical protein